MHADYYQSTLYPLQDKVLKIVGESSADFYLTRGTALSRAYLFHRYSDDLDFFVNGVIDFKSKVNTLIKEFSESGFKFDIPVADEGFARIFIIEEDCTLKIDFVNDIPFRSGTPIASPLFIRTDNLTNIQLNKVTALGRYSAKDIVDIVFISEILRFNWSNIIADASEKDLWVNPIAVAEVLEQFPEERLQEIAWIKAAPSANWFRSQIERIIPDILYGSENSLYFKG
jgi:hypothetical protein